MTFLADVARMTEAAWQRQVIQVAELRGFRVYHTYDSRRSAAGFPDLVMVRRPRVVWAELKADRGRLSEAQKAWLDDLRASGQEVYVWRPSDFEEMIRVLR